MSTENTEPTGQGNEKAFSCIPIARCCIFGKGIGIGPVILDATVSLLTLATLSKLTSASSC